MFARKQQLNDSFTSSLAPLNRPADDLPLGQRGGRTRDMNSFELDIERIRVDEDQVRRSGKSPDDPEIIELARSIKDHGVLQGLSVRYVPDGDYYELIAGERRFVAAKVAGLTRVPVKLLDVDDKTACEIQLVENLQRSDLRPVDIGLRLQQMLEAGETLATLEQKIHKSQSWISKVVAIARNLSDEAKQIAETTSVAHLYEVSQLPRESQASVVTQIRGEGLTVEQLRELTHEAKAQSKQQRCVRRGRPTKGRSKPYEKSFKAAHGLFVIVRARRATVTPDELLEAFRALVTALEDERARHAA
jgi:ParB/RepB/Spo0J family partition protein